MAQQSAVGIEAVRVVDVQEAPDRSGQGGVVGTRRAVVEAGLPLEPGPAPSPPPVDVVEAEPGVVEELAQGAWADAA